MFSFSSIELYHSALQNKQTSCVEAVNHYLQKIQAGLHLNAFVNVFAEEALQRAILLDEQRSKKSTTGKLHGVVIAIKDVICYKDHPLTAASGILKDFVSIYSSTAIERLIREEAIIIGVCNCDEFAMGSSNENSVYGPALNARDITRVPGGSSGGSAVAVQAGMCMAALGSDTGGSVRQPADFCGIVGFKPGYGTISRYGLIAYASSFDQIGIFANNIDDVERLLDVMHGPDDYDSTVAVAPQPIADRASGKKKFRISYFREMMEHPSLDPEIRESIARLIVKLQADGHEVEALGFEYLDFVVPAYYILTTAEASSNLSRYDGVRYGYRTKEPGIDLTEFYKRTRSEGFGKEVKRRIMLGTFVLSAGYYDAYFTRAQQVRRLLLEKTTLVFSKFDFLLMPTSPTVAFRIGEKTKDPIDMYLADIYTVFANLTGIPAISLPLFNHSNGMPFGMQLMAKRFDELSLLEASKTLMRNYAVNGY